MFHLTKKYPSGQHKAEKDICFIEITYKYTIHIRLSCMVQGYDFG